MSMYFLFLPPSPPAGTTQNRNLAESMFTETVNVNVVLPAPPTDATIMCWLNYIWPIEFWQNDI